MKLIRAEYFTDADWRAFTEAKGDNLARKLREDPGRWAVWFTGKGAAARSRLNVDLDRALSTRLATLAVREGHAGDLALQVLAALRRLVRDPLDCKGDLLVLADALEEAGGYERDALSVRRFCAREDLVIAEETMTRYCLFRGPSNGESLRLLESRRELAGAEGD